MEIVDTGAGYQSGEFTGFDSEIVSYRRETKDHLQLFPDLVHEILVHRLSGIRNSESFSLIS